MTLLLKIMYRIGKVLYTCHCLHPILIKPVTLASMVPIFFTLLVIKSNARLKYQNYIHWYMMITFSNQLKNCAYSVEKYIQLALQKYNHFTFPAIFHTHPVFLCCTLIEIVFKIWVQVVIILDVNNYIWRTREASLILLSLDRMGYWVWHHGHSDIRTYDNKITANIVYAAGATAHK